MTKYISLDIYCPFVQLYYSLMNTNNRRILFRLIDKRFYSPYVVEKGCNSRSFLCATILNAIKKKDE
ncbi:MAG: hypothetical protein AABY22_06795 [Nanoarchaeota archaeon]